MAVFTYQAVTTEGETKSGTIAASSEQEAVAKVQLMGLMVMNIASGAAAAESKPSRFSGLRSRKTLKHTDIVDLTRQMAVLIGSGLNRWLVLLIMMAIVFLMGMFIDWAAILLITVPIFMPIVLELDFNPLWSRCKTKPGSPFPGVHF